MNNEGKKNKRKTGTRGEEIACGFLTNLGYKILERNYQFGHGEIDIIAEDGDTIVFVEVKYRKNLDYGPPESAVTLSKQKQIRKIASAYLWENEIKERQCRIDVVAVLHYPGNKPEITHYINAF